MTVVATMSITLDGVGSAPDQTEQRPFGDVPEGVLHNWMQDGGPESARGDGGHPWCGRLHHGPQHVRPRPGRVERRLAGLVGSQSPYPLITPL